MKALMLSQLRQPSNLRNPLNNRTDDLEKGLLVQTCPPPHSVLSPVEFNLLAPQCFPDKANLNELAGESHSTFYKTNKSKIASSALLVWMVLLNFHVRIFGRTMVPLIYNCEYTLNILDIQLKSILLQNFAGLGWTKGSFVENFRHIIIFYY